MAENCIKCTGSRPTPPHKNPMDSELETTFQIKMGKKTIKPPQKGASFFYIF